MQRPRIILPLAAGLVFIGSYLAMLRDDPHQGFPNAHPRASADVHEAAFTNRLIHEKSPYLLQHAHNPVDWYAWGDEAFQAARGAGKPIFLSIGYSTCYWCHVMEREVFEDTAIAGLMNAELVCIKVDREERPDIDRIYMAAVQAMTGSGGWPMSVFMTPDGKPFFGATYIPPRAQYGRPGFPDIIRRVAELWKTDREKLLASGEDLVAHLRAVHGASGAVADSVPEYAVRRFALNFDSLNGGFGGGPKFPRPSVLNFLLRYAHRTGNPQALEMSLATLTAMANGGMYDQIGGGFHRYAVDGEWRVPHFEKMLYDQAQLVCSYLEAYQITGRQSYAEIARDVLAYVRRELTHPEGGFYSAEDAESAPDPAAPDRKSEGACYLWTKAEIMEVCGTDAGEILAYHYGIEEGGNAPHDPLNVFTGKNIPYIAHPVEATAAKFGKPENEIRPLVARCRRMLFERRRGRPRPHLDDKVLASWNGLMISAFARSAQAFGDAEDRITAERAAGFILSRLTVDGQLLRRYRDGDARFSAGLEDYAFFVQGLLDLYECSFDVRWLEEAIALTRRQTDLLWDEAEGGFYDTPAGDGSLLMRTKEEYDGAEPAGNSVAAMNLLRLAQLTGDERWHTMAQRTVETLGSRLASEPEVAPQMLCALEWLRSTANEIIVVGSRNDPGTRDLLREIWRRYLPHKVVAVIEEGDVRRRLEALLPYVQPMHEVGGRPTVYVCVRQACQLPVNEPNKLVSILERR